MSGYRKPYTRVEEREILNYIIEHNAYNRLRGISLWQEMEKANIGERSYQSLKEHFRKVIIGKVCDKQRNYYRLDEDKVEKIISGYQATAKDEKKKLNIVQRNHS